MNGASPNRPRPAWVEVDLDRLRNNFRIVRAFTPARVRILCVVKAEAYGHGSVAVARMALREGASMLGVATLGEAATLRAAGLQAPILLFGNHPPDSFADCRELNLTLALGDLELARALHEFGRVSGWRPAVHVKVNTGMNRYGLRWSEVATWLPVLGSLDTLRIEGVFSHFAMSDEADKTFAHAQYRRLAAVLSALAGAGLNPGLRHLCNTGGLLDLPEAHLDLVRIGILPLGVYPSQACRRLPGLEPVLSVKARVAALQTLDPGETVGYGLKFSAPSRRRVAILPLGYADGFPRVRNEGHVLLHGCPVPIVGGVAMDAMAVDVTDVPDVRLFDEAVLLGRQKEARIAVDDLAQLKHSVCYDVLAGWRSRLPRVYVGENAGDTP